MDNRHRGVGGGAAADRYGGSSPDPHHRFNSSNYSRAASSSRYSSNSNTHHHHYHQHRNSPINNGNNNPPNNYRGEGVGDRDRDRDRDYRRSFDSPPPPPPPPHPRYPPSPAGTPGIGGGWSRPMSSSDWVGDGSGFHAMSPVLGQKRGYTSFSDDIRGPPPPPDRLHEGSFAKLFVGSVPLTATEEDIRPVFDKHGRVLEVALIRHKRTGQQQGPLRSS